MATIVLSECLCQEHEISILADRQLKEPRRPEASDAYTAFQDAPGVEVESYTRHWVSLRLKPELSALEHVVCYVRQSFGSFPEELRENLTLALKELLENAIEHGCKFDSRNSVTFSFVITEHMIMFQIRDSGDGFSLDGINHAALNNPPNQPLLHVEYRCNHGMRPGGYGIFLAKRIADELLYNESGNEVLFVKNF